MNFARRGEIYLVSFDPTVGHEIQKTRPAVIIQNDISNEHSPVTIVAAVTSKFGNPVRPREVLIPAGVKTGLVEASAVVLNQIRSIDRSRLQKRLGMVDDATMRRVDEAIKISLGLITF